MKKLYFKSSNKRRGIHLFLITCFCCGLLACGENNSSSNESEMVKKESTTPSKDTLGDKADEVVNGVTDGVDSMVDGATNGVNDLVDGVTDSASDLVNGASQGVQDIADGVTDSSQTVGERAKQRATQRR